MIDACKEGSREGSRKQGSMPYYSMAPYPLPPAYLKGPGNRDGQMRDNRNLNLHEDYGITVT